MKLNKDKNIILNLIKLLRPKQWIKNGFVFIPFLFAGKMPDVAPLSKGIIVFVAFCLIASSVYILNDLSDLDFDKAHPEKKDRPLASGKISIKLAVCIMFLLASCSALISSLLSREVGWIIVLYVISNILYSLYFKNVVIIDIFFIALGFLLRVSAGICATGVPPSSWIIIMTMALSLLLAVGKRRADILSSDNSLKSHRKVLHLYSIKTIDQMIVILVSLIIITFSLYAVSDYAVLRFGSEALVLTIPIVVYGLFRYLYIVNDEKSTGDPTKILLSDHHMYLCVLTWLLACAWIIYR